MPYPSDWEAEEALVEAAGDALACVWRHNLHAEPGFGATRRDRVLLLSEHRQQMREPVRLSRQPPVQLRFRVDYRVEPGAGGEWDVRLLAYAYALIGKKDNDDAEIIAYHWHPASIESPLPYPHLHLKGGVRLATQPRDTRAHIPTGWVTLEDVLRLAVDAFGVPKAKPNAEAIWRETRRVVLASLPTTERLMW